MFFLSETPPLHPVEAYNAILNTALVLIGLGLSWFLVRSQVDSQNRSDRRQLRLLTWQTQITYRQSILPELITSGNELLHRLQAPPPLTNAFTSDIQRLGFDIRNLSDKANEAIGVINSNARAIELTGPMTLDAFALINVPNNPQMTNQECQDTMARIRVDLENLVRTFRQLLNESPPTF